MLVFEERGKPVYPEKNLSEQSREPTNSVHIWRRVRESTRDTLVEGERSHHCANPAPQKNRPWSGQIHGCPLIDRNLLWATTTWSRTPVGRVVGKSVNVNPQLKVNRGNNFPSLKMLSAAYVLCSSRLFMLKTEGQKISTEHLAQKLQKSNQNSR